MSRAPICNGCGARSGHYSGCVRNRWRLPKLVQPKPGSAASVKLEARIREQLRYWALRADPVTGVIR